MRTSLADTNQLPAYPSETDLASVFVGRNTDVSSLDPNAHQVAGLYGKLVEVWFYNAPLLITRLWE
jgi:hypothetical protein